MSLTQIKKALERLHTFKGTLLLDEGTPNVATFYHGRRAHGRQCVWLQDGSSGDPMGLIDGPGTVGVGELGNHANAPVWMGPEVNYTSSDSKLKVAAHVFEEIPVGGRFSGYAYVRQTDQVAFRTLLCGFLPEALKNLGDNVEVKNARIQCAASVSEFSYREGYSEIFCSFQTWWDEGIKHYGPVWDDMGLTYTCDNTYVDEPYLTLTLVGIDWDGKIEKLGESLSLLADAESHWIDITAACNAYLANRNRGDITHIYGLVSATIVENEENSLEFFESIPEYQGTQSSPWEWDYHVYHLPWKSVWLKTPSIDIGEWTLTIGPKDGKTMADCMPTLAPPRAIQRLDPQRESVLMPLTVITSRLALGSEICDPDQTPCE